MMPFAVLAQQKKMVLNEFGANVNNKCEVLSPIYSRAANRLYFVRTACNDDDQLVQRVFWIEQDKDGKWIEDPTPLPYVINNNSFNAVVGVSLNGDKLFLNDVYPSGLIGQTMGVAVSNYNGKEWSVPEKYEDIKEIAKKKPQGNIGFNVHSAGNVILVSFYDGHTGSDDIYLIYKNENDEWSKMIRLPSQVNTTSNEISPFLTEDMMTLYFSSNRSGGVGDYDIYKVSRKSTDNWVDWSEVELMKEPVNSNGFDAYYSVTGNKAFFSSNRNSPYAKLYQITEEKIAPPKKPEKIEKPSPKLPPKPKVAVLPSNIVVHFDFNSSTLVDSEKKAIDKAMSNLKEESSLRLDVFGYTDDYGNRDYNELLSEKRAEAVKNYLRTAWPEFKMIDAEGKGVVDGSDHKSINERRQYRKVVISFHKK
ncbi:hypothetical protein AUTU_26080 [Aureibacter tunicatorum]|nr:hypothetical protein AUTU_26080 [Aureibacter tunicatorum]